MIFHRIVKSNPPTARDFAVAIDRGLAARLAPEIRRLQTGVSAYRTLRQAAAKARRYQGLGSFVAIVDVPAGSTVRFERTTQQRGHFTLWGEPDALLRCVVAVVPISEVP